MVICLALASVKRRTCWAHAPCFIPKHNTCTTSCKHSDSSDQTLPRDFDCMLVVLWWPATTRFATCCEAYHPRTTSQGLSCAAPRLLRQGTQHLRKCGNLSDMSHLLRPLPALAHFSNTSHRATDHVQEREARTHECTRWPPCRQRWKMDFSRKGRRVQAAVHQKNIQFAYIGSEA